MARGKALFIGDGTRESHDWRFSESIREKIKSLYPEPSNQSDDEYERIFLNLANSSQSPADHFVDAIENEAEWAYFEIIELDKQGQKKDVKAELISLLDNAQIVSRC